MKKQEYFKLVKHINKNVRAVGYRYVRCFSEPRKKGTKYRTKLWAAGNGEQLVEYINTNFGDKVKAELHSKTVFFTQQKNRTLVVHQFLPPKICRFTLLNAVF